MADTTTAILGLTKVGAPSTNSWGGKWNTNFDTIDALFELNGGEPVLKQAKGGTGAKTAAAARTSALACARCWARVAATRAAISPRARACRLSRPKL